MKRAHFAYFLLLHFLVLNYTLFAQKPKKNIVVIVADDLGFSDLGCFGSEIKTPNIDALAKQGIINTSYYSGPTCSPSRSMLLSGVDNHRNGLGTMDGDWDTNQVGVSGYEGYLNFKVLPISEILQKNGYYTSIVGKWHLAHPANETKLYPTSRGFNRSFTLVAGGSSHFSDKIGLFKGANPIYESDGKILEKLPEDFYSSHFYTNKAIEFIDESVRKKQPFFTYVAYTAPHWPLQVPDQDLELYKGRYDMGYEKLRIDRFEAMKKLKIIPQNATLGSRLPNVYAWDKLSAEEKQKSAKTMEIYAAMIENLDSNIGRLIAHLKETNQYENTLILFMSDNGAEGNNIGTYENTSQWIAEEFDNSLANMGKKNSYIYLGAAWAQVCSTPFKWYKAFAHEGGVRCPMIISGGLTKAKNVINTNWLSVLDIYPTILDLANVNYPKMGFNGQKIYPLDGRSFTKTITTPKQVIHQKNVPMCGELYGRKYVRWKNWTMVSAETPYGSDNWELYDIEHDMGQTRNLITKYPKIIHQMKAFWADYQKKYGVVLPIHKMAYGIENDFDKYQKANKK